MQSTDDLKSSFYNLNHYSTFFIPNHHSSSFQIPLCNLGARSRAHFPPNPTAFNQCPWKSIVADPVPLPHLSMQQSKSRMHFSVVQCFALHPQSASIHSIGARLHSARRTAGKELCDEHSIFNAVRLLLDAIWIAAGQFLDAAIVFCKSLQNQVRTYYEKPQFQSSI